MLGLAVVGGDGGGAIMVVKFDTIERGATLNDVWIGGAEAFALGEDIDGFKDGSLTAAVLAENEGSSIVALERITGVIAEISKADRLDNHSRILYKLYYSVV